MKLKLFTLNPKTRLVDIDKEWISTIKEFREILKRDRGSEGDHDGRMKKQATREFTFLYHYCDYGSKFINYSEKDKLHECLINAELPTGTDISKDELLSKAVMVYKGLQTTASIKLLTELKEGVHTSYRVVKKIREPLEAKLDSINLDEVIEQEGANGKTIRIDPVEQITKRLESLLKISNTLPDTLDAIEKQEERVKLEMADDSTIRGGYNKGVREDASPDTQGIAGGLMSKTS